MAIAYAPGKVFEHVLEEDKALPKEQQTVWQLASLSAKEMEQIEDDSTIDPITRQMSMKIGSKTNSLLRMGLKGWKNFRSAEGNEVEYAKPEQGMCAWANIDRVKPAHRLELARAIERGNILSEGERKNS